jgi:glycine/D-amino acid oxidase-like deaminating enzyme
MTQSTPARRVAVVGGGVLGTSVAAHLAARGAEVTLVTEAGPASGASGRSLSWLNSSGPHPEEYHRLRSVGLERYRALAARPGTTARIAFDGGLMWATPGEGQCAQLEWMRATGYPAELLSRDQVRERIPGVDPSAVPDEGAISNPAEGWVDLPSLVDQLARDLVAAGGAVRTGAGRCRTIVQDGRVTGVRTGSGDVLTADAVLLATGAAVPGALAELGVAVPDASTNAVLVRTAPFDHRLRAVLNTPRVSLRPAPGGGLVIDAGWSEEEVVARDDGTFEVHDWTVAGLLAEASRVLEGNPPLTVASCGAGRKPIPADGHPVLGAVDAVPGLYVAFTHSGATLGLVAGELLAADILTGSVDPLLVPFRLDRFSRRS